MLPPAAETFHLLLVAAAAALVVQLQLGPEYSLLLESRLLLLLLLPVVGRKLTLARIQRHNERQVSS